MMRKGIREDGNNDLTVVKEMSQKAFDLAIAHAVFSLVKDVKAGKVSADDLMITMGAFITTEAFVKFYPDIESMADWIEKVNEIEWVQEKTNGR
jgi:hypothetical protein